MTGKLVRSRRETKIRVKKRKSGGINRRLQVENGELEERKSSGINPLLQRLEQKRRQAAALQNVEKTG